MEEVDQIIIISLRGLGCDIPDEVCSVKEVWFSAVNCCQCPSAMLAYPFP